MSAFDTAIEIQALTLIKLCSPTCQIALAVHVASSLHGASFGDEWPADKRDAIEAFTTIAAALEKEACKDFGAS